MPKKSAASEKVHDLALANRLLDSFGRIAAILGTPHLDYDQRLARILNCILDYLGVEQGSIMVVAGKKKELVVRAATRTELIGHTQRLDNGSVAAWVARHREPLFIPDIARDKRFRSQCRQHYKKNALLSVPILRNDKLLGIINVTDKAGEENLLKEDITRLLDFTGLVLSLLVQQSLQEELKKQRDTLRQRNQELQRQQAMRAELSKLLIHDLKGPLSEVVANLDILSYSIGAEQREFLEAAQIGCNRAVRMVANLGTIDKIEDGKLSLIRETVDPKVILEESLSSMRGLARIKNIGITLAIPDEELPRVELDRILILRVMQNLLTNALGYSPPGTAITFGCQVLPGGRKLEFFVQDQGTGIPPEKRTAVFEKYARISDRQDALVGTGLGLYFCRLAVELHRGRIGVETPPAGGSRFFFTLPL
ncbi:MAG: ATP-binding protein [Thermodesulfobacteriota bacterium]